MLERCLRVGRGGGIRMNRLPRGYEARRHVMSWRMYGSEVRPGFVGLLVPTHLDLIKRRADLGRQWHKEEVQRHELGCRLLGASHRPFNSHRMVAGAGRVRGPGT